jgi:hypothetical protein
MVAMFRSTHLRTQPRSRSTILQHFIRQMIWCAKCIFCSVSYVSAVERRTPLRCGQGPLGGPLTQVDRESYFRGSRRSAGPWDQAPPDGHITEPLTDAQFRALRHLEYIALAQAPQAPPVAKRSKALAGAVRKNFWRFCIFTVSDLLALSIGLALQVALIHYVKLGRGQSYIGQTLVSVQLGFLLARYITWRDRATPFLGALGRFNAQQFAVTGIGVIVYAGIEHVKMTHATVNIVVSALLIPVSFLINHNWSMAERKSRVTFKTLPWPLFLVLAVQAVLSLRLIWSNTAYIDEATYLYAGSQELDHWMHGIVVQDYQSYFSGSPAVYPPLGAIASALGGLTGARILSLCFLLGTTALLYLTTKRLFGAPAAFLGIAVFAGLGVTQFLSALATYDPMALFLLALASYLTIGRDHTYNTLTDVALSTVLTAVILALANACKYATALWDPVVIGLACCAPPMAGYTWRYGWGRAIQLLIALASLLTVGIAIGKAKYIQGILYTTLDRSSNNSGMGQSPTIVFNEAWQWVGVVFVIAAIGVLLLLSERRSTPYLVMGFVLMAALVAAPLNQARIGTTTSLHKHVVFGAWFGCVLAGYALNRLLRSQWFSITVAVAILVTISALSMSQAYSLFHTWSQENPIFITELKKYVHPNDGRYLIEGYSDIPAYYAGSNITSTQWKETIAYSYRDPRTGAELSGPSAISAAVRNRVFTAIIINFTPGKPEEIADDDAVAAAISRFGGYRKVAELPASTASSHAIYTVWERVSN